MLSSPSQAVCGSPATSVPQCWHVTAGTLRWRVGSGCSGRCAPAGGLPLGLLVGALDLLRPLGGGVLALSGAFGGRLSFPRSAAFSASRAASRLLNSSIRASNVAISASFSALVRAGESKGGITHTLTHIRPPDATAFTIIESICRTKPCSHNRGLSNYHRSNGAPGGCAHAHKHGIVYAGEALNVERACPAFAPRQPLQLTIVPRGQRQPGLLLASEPASITDARGGSRHLGNGP